VRLHRWSAKEQMHASQMSISTTRYTYMMTMTARLRTLYFLCSRILFARAALPRPVSSATALHVAVVQKLQLC
jgi:hypothetical protein